MIGQRINKRPLDAVFAELAADGSIRRLAELARDEDLGPAGVDVTSELFKQPARSALITPREDGILAGLATLPIIAEVFGGFEANCVATDGDRVSAGVPVAKLAGAVTTPERTILNLLGRLSGVATLTARYVAESGKGGPARVCDTRKTTPGMRALEKYAVRSGGGWVHRIGLYDAVLVKDNHIAGVPAADLGSFIRGVAERARPRLGQDGFIMVEVDTRDQLRSLLTSAGDAIDAVLLDNMGPAELRAAVSMCKDLAPHVETEASGGVTLESIAAIAEAGVDRISVGAITRDARTLDFGLDAD